MTLYLFCYVPNVHRRAGMPEKNTKEGDAQPDADNCVIDSQSQHSAASHTPGARIWTSEALSGAK